MVGNWHLNPPLQYLRISLCLFFFYLTDGNVATKLFNGMLLAKKKKKCIVFVSEAFQTHSVLINHPSALYSQLCLPPLCLSLSLSLLILAGCLPVPRHSLSLHSALFLCLCFLLSACLSLSPPAANLVVPFPHCLRLHTQLSSSLFHCVFCFLSLEALIISKSLKRVTPSDISPGSAATQRPFWRAGVVALSYGVVGTHLFKPVSRKTTKLMTTLWARAHITSADTENQDLTRYRFLWILIPILRFQF